MIAAETGTKGTAARKDMANGKKKTRHRGELLVSGGVVHSVPSDWREALLSVRAVYERWEDITPLARNEWICWIEDAKKEETRKRRIAVGLSKLASGMRRPCCWAGCVHRSR